MLKGIFDTRTEKYNADIHRFDQQIDAKQTYLDQFQDALVAKFANLEEVVGQLNAQGQALTAGEHLLRRDVEVGAELRERRAGYVADLEKVRGALEMLGS